MDKIYIVIIADSSDEEFRTEVKAFRQKSKARDYMNALVLKAEEDLVDEMEDLVINSSEDFWCAYKEGCYTETGASIRIEEVEIQE